MPWWGWLLLVLATLAGIGLIVWGGLMEQRHCLAEIGTPSEQDEQEEAEYGHA